MEKQFCMDVSMVMDSGALERIKNLSIPGCLTRRKLMVGDEEQVRALRALERTAEDIIADCAENEYYEDNEHYWD